MEPTVPSRTSFREGNFDAPPAALLQGDSAEPEEKASATSGAPVAEPGFHLPRPQAQPVYRRHCQAGSRDDHPARPAVAIVRGVAGAGWGGGQRGKKTAVEAN